MDMFKTHFESGERATDEVLMTHYYKNNYQQTKAGLLEVAKELDFNVAFEDDIRQELMLKRKDCEVIVTSQYSRSNQLWKRKESHSVFISSIR